jgi:hypothetical protein
MDACEKGEAAMLVQNTVLKAGRKITGVVSSLFQANMLKGDVLGAVKYLTKTENRGVILPDDVDEKYGLAIKYFLQSKHPRAMTPLPYYMYRYDEMPDMFNADVTHDTIEQMARNLLGSSGMGGVDSLAVSRWRLAFGVMSESLRHLLANFTNWLANNLPIWAAYRVMWVGRLLAMDKLPGVRPIGVGEW